MKAVEMHGYGGLDQLCYEEVPTPIPGASTLTRMVAVSSA